MKKKMTALLLALILCGSLAACGGGQNTAAEDKKDNEAVDTVKDEENKDKAEDETGEKDKTEVDKDTAAGSETSNSGSQSKPQTGSTGSNTSTGSGSTSKPQSGGSTSSGSSSSSGSATSKPSGGSSSGNTSSGGTSTSKPDPAPAPAPQPKPEPEPEPAQPTAVQASGYIGSSASALEGALGSPSSKTYSPSCMGEGEDGVWTYSGFTVYTYRENGVETVEAVA